MGAVLSAERKLGHRARDMNDEQRNHPGYDIETFAPSEADSSDALHFIEVKGRISGSTTVTVSRNEILTGLNSPDQFILALVDVSFDGSQHDKVRYLRRPIRRNRRYPLRRDEPDLLLGQIVESRSGAVCCV